MSEQATQQLQQLLRMVDTGQSAEPGESLEMRLTLMKIVERAVRPVRASSGRKLKMREELLAHLTEIHEQERTQLRDRVQATQAAARRFGDPTDLALELQSAVPWWERVEARMERWFGWRAPESVARYLVRVTVQVYLAISIMTVTAAVSYITKLGWNASALIGLRPIFAMHLIMPATFLLLGLLYFEQRNTIFGVFGRRRSLSRVGLWTALFVLVVVMCGSSFEAIAAWDWSAAARMVIPYAAVGLVAAIGSLVVALHNGPSQIRQALWTCLDLET